VLGSECFHGGDSLWDGTVTKAARLGEDESGEEWVRPSLSNARSQPEGERCCDKHD
jgi:hypothetical protein